LIANTREPCSNRNFRRISCRSILESEGSEARHFFAALTRAHLPQLLH
jgi:hypothetical protein